MEMTMPDRFDPKLADFTNQSTSHGGFSQMTTVAGFLFGLFAGPGSAAANPAMRQWDLPSARETASHTSSQDDASAMVAPAADQIAALKEGWRLNMTDLAEIMDVQRPTLYNWLNGKTSPNAEARQKLDLLVAAAPVWHQLTTKSSDSFLLDYTGPDEAGPSIRQRLKSPDCSLAELTALIPQRIEQYQEARARSLALLGERPPMPDSAPSKAAWRMNRQWAQNAKSLHRAHKRAD